MSVPRIPGPPDGEISDWLAGRFGGAWMPWHGGPADTRLWAQFQADADGRTVLVGMLLLSGGITCDVLRRVPVGALESAAREADFGGEQQLETELAKLPALQRGDLPPIEFSRLVAQHYRLWARHTSRPAAAMMRASGRKSGTVHGWIHEARQRGLLPEAERGKRARG